MECRDIEEMLSAAHDGATLTPEERSALKEHCASCESCLRFNRGLSTLDRAPSPVAPPELTDRVLGEIDALVEQGATAETPTPVPVPAPIVAPALVADERRAATRRNWVFGSSLAAAAAVVLVAILWGTGAFKMLGGAKSATDGRTVITVQGGSSAESGSLAAAPAGAMANATVAPDAISFGDNVYVPGSAVDASGSTLTTIGVVTSSFDANGAIAQATAYRPPLADGSIIVRTPKGLQQFKPVVRTFNGTDWQEAAGVNLLHYGAWPRLPNFLPEPVSADGSPTFRQAGMDSAGVAVYTRGGAAPSDGFAIAPGTAANDPAHGNPYWTWWVPVVKP